MNIEFTKMTGAGNDFVLVDNRDRRLKVDWTAFARVACDRRYGVGADGILVIEPSDKVDFAMLYFNADGSYGGMCGTGGRCVSLFMAEATGKTELAFEALDYVYCASRKSDGILLSMKNPVDIQLHQTLDINHLSLEYHFVNTGSPHVVFYWDSLPESLRIQLETNGINEFGKSVRSHPRFQPDGTNVNFVKIVGEKEIAMRTYERGVEAETLACGTGSVACSVMSALVLELPSPVTVRTHGNELLKVHFEVTAGEFRQVRLQGPAKVVFHGSFAF
jgi:diaminopimelate epimerase